MDAHMTSGISTGVPDRTATAYGSFLARFRALLTDALILLAGTIAVMVVGAATSRREIFFLALAFWLLYEPILVSRYGATVGHRYANLRIVSERTGGNISFASALVRFLVKSLLGLPSFIVMALTRRQQALHDWLAGTTVRIDDLNRAKPLDIAWERSDAELEPAGLPSRTRRLLVLVGYLFGSFVAMSIAHVFATSEACILEDKCTSGERLRISVISLIWLGLSAYCIIAGWRGRLWGARIRASVVPSPGV